MNIIKWLKSLFSPKKDPKELIQFPPKVKPAPIVVEPPKPKMPEIPSLEEIGDELLSESRRWVGTLEHGYNSGPEVEEFQKYTDGKAQKESWCMAWARYVAGQVCARYGVKNPIYPSEHCNTVYNHTPDKYKSDKWGWAFMFIMKSKVDSSGHTGYCAVYEMAYEGNTDPGGATDGDGVYYRYRSSKGSKTKPMRGYINVPLMIQDAIREARA